MSGEDEADRLLRKVRERQQQIIDGIARGTAPADMSPLGYPAMAAQVRAYDDVIEIIHDVFSGWLPPLVKTKEAPKKFDY